MPEGQASRQLRDISFRMKQATNPVDARGLRLGMTRAMRTAAGPVIQDARVRAYNTLPKSGGLAEREATQKIPVSVLSGARTAGVRVRANRLGGYQADQTGEVRHPTFGRRGQGQWTVTKTPAAEGWWTKTWEQSGGKVTAEIMKVLEETAARINAGGIL